VADRPGTWITLVARAEGNARDGFRIAHYWDGRKFTLKSGAVSNGFTATGTDDFNVALIEEMRKPFPAGESCLYCEELFSEEAKDSGQAMPFGKADGTAEIRHVHKECAFRAVAGGLAHHEGRCSCHGGSTETPGLTYRQEALEVWRRMRAGELFR